MMQSPPLLIAILAGGQSRRMGRDKTELWLGGEPMLERAVRTALLTGQRVMVVGRERPADYPVSPGLRRVVGVDEVRFVPDERRGVGPLGGLLSVLRRAPLAVTMAADMPMLDVASVRWLLAEASGRDLVHGLVVRRGVDIEPLFAVYTAACLELVLEQLSAGRLSLRQLVDAGEFARAEAPPWLVPRLRNVNTPQDADEAARALGPGRGE